MFLSPGRLSPEALADALMPRSGAPMPQQQRQPQPLNQHQPLRPPQGLPLTNMSPAHPEDVPLSPPTMRDPLLNSNPMPHGVWKKTLDDMYDRIKEATDRGDFDTANVLKQLSEDWSRRNLWRYRQRAEDNYQELPNRDDFRGM